MKKQIFNPFLPLDEYIPDGEPHVFGGRVYLFGSHDSEGGQRYCAEGNYVGWSAPVDDLTAWRYEGIIYEATQDKRFGGITADLYAPDVVRGNDGRYYLYYGIENGGPAGSGHNTPVGVAVCDTPAGRYEYYGQVQYPDGSPFLRYLPADPAVINDEGVIRLYYGWALSLVAGAAHGHGEPNHAPLNMPREQLVPVEKMLFHRSEEELLSEPLGVMGANHVELANDMLTVKSEPARILPSQFNCLGTSFEGHAFYEASSIRKINGVYYFIYSSQESNELCYATSAHPDRDFVFRGTIISNGDVGYQGRRHEDRLNMTGNNHGSLECINGQWYVFYHRQTHNSTFSRQACAEPVTFLADGSIPQVECTSCGLNGGPLAPAGEYPAPIACNLTNGHMPHITNRVLNGDIPYITHGEGERFITGIQAGTLIGFKYFAFEGPVRLTLTLRGTGNGRFEVQAGEAAASLTVVPGERWYTVSGLLCPTATAALYLTYQGEGSVELLNIRFDP